MAISYVDFNTIENRIEDLSVISSSIPTYTKTVWDTSKFPYIQEVQRIETGIDNLSRYLILPICYVKKVWLENLTDRPLKPFSRNNDLVRWQNNLNCIEEYLAKIELRFASEGYSGDDIWL